MFGNTTPCITHAREILEGKNYEVLVFHATGTGGRTMEELIADGYITANLDLTTTELADEVCGGVFSAGPDRMMAAARSGVPTVLAPGCVDMANFHARADMPQKYQSRLLYEWNPNVTLMRTNVDENRAIGEMIARAANASTGPVAVLIPLQGVSQLDSPGGAFWDPEADGACFTAIKENLNARHSVHRNGQQYQRPGICRKSGGFVVGDALSLQSPIIRSPMSSIPRSDARVWTKTSPLWKSLTPH